MQINLTFVPTLDSNFCFTDCKFVGNYARNTTNGGGLQLSFHSNATRIQLVIKRCIFENNTAFYGGGVYIMCNTGSQFNAIEVQESNFSFNHAVKMGGAVAIVYQTAKNCTAQPPVLCYPNSSHTYIKECYIVNNTAEYGGGLAVIGDTSGCKKEEAPDNHVKFTNSQWLSNMAKSGSAVDVSINRFQSKNTGNIFMASIKFTNCQFKRNMPFGSHKGNGQAGTVATSEVMLSFDGQTLFERNTMTALYSASAQLGFFGSAHATFHQNTGDKVGAIYLSGDASILFNANVFFNFSQNKATIGGAIYALPLQTHYMSYTDVCFLKQQRYQSTSHNIFLFLDNKADTNLGNDIFVTSLRPCHGLCIHQKGGKNLSDLSFPNAYFSNACTGNFLNGVPKYATDPINISTSQAANVQLFPGIEHKFNISQIDEGGNEVSSIFPLTATVSSKNDQVCVQANYISVTNNVTIINGPLEEEGNITFETSASTAMWTTVQFAFSQHCPPGLVFDEMQYKCACPALSREGTTWHTGITYCENNNAHINIGYWAGYTNVSEQTEFVTGVCPTELCGYGGISQSQGQYQLPLDSNKLSENVCSRNRTGTLCGKCLEGQSTYYHSPTYKCGNAIHGCSYGILLYVFSELLPVTVLFLTILLFNINLTSGALYSFVFFAQMLDSLFIDAFATIHIDDTRALRIVLSLLKGIYGLFNLNILSNDSFSFCIIAEASVMHIFMFKFVTFTFSLLLIFAVIFVLKVNSLYSCVRFFRKCGRRDIRGSVISGLSAFLVLCYSQCTGVSAKMLQTSWLHGKNGTIVNTVLLYNGELRPLEGVHVWFALPAIVCSIIVILPPIVILSLELPLVALCNLSVFDHTAFQYCVLKCRLKLKPFLDVFQGCFKNSCRYFAGLYFLYRAMVPLIQITAKSGIESYVINNIVLMIILLIHSLVHPYQKKWHNQLDNLILTNLIIINSFTIFNYYTYITRTSDSINVRTVMWVQIILMALPLVFIGTHMAVNVYHSLKHCKLWHLKNASDCNNALNHSVIEQDSQNLPVFPDRILEEEGLLEHSNDLPSYDTF